MNFLGFLVKEKKISDSHVEKVLEERIEGSANIIKVIKSLKGFPDGFFNDLVCAGDDLNIIAILVEMGHLNSEDLIEIEKKQFENSQCLLDLLSKHTDLNNEELNSLYESWSNLSAKHKEKVENEVSSEVEINSAALESLRELTGSGAIDESVLSDLTPVDESKIESIEETGDSNIFNDEFVQTINKKFENKLVKEFKFIKEAYENNSDPTNMFNSLYRDILLVKGAASLASITSLVELFSAFENMIEGLLSRDHEDYTSNSSSFLNISDDLLNNILQVFNDIRSNNFNENKINEIINLIQTNSSLKIGA